MFTSTPEHYGSLYQSQNFEFTGTFIEDQTYEIKEVNTGDILGVKKFYQTDAASVNVAPIVRPFAIPTPSSLATQFVTDDRFGAINVVVAKTGSVDTEEYESDSCVFALSHSDEDEVGLVSSLPTTRSISMGESEFVLIRCEPLSTIKVIVRQYEYDAEGDGSSSASAVVEYSIEDDGRGFVVFSTAAELLGNMATNESTMERYALSINTLTLLNPGSAMPNYGTVEIANLEYLIIDPPNNPMRLAWISNRGSLEHYTMPYIASEMMQRSGERIFTLQSALETYEMREALAEVVSAEAVWVVEDGEYRELTIIDDQIELSPEEDLTSIKFKSSYGD